jgi:hypothetical protein
MKDKKKTPSIEELNSEESMKTIEKKAQEFMNSPNTSLAVTEDVRLEKLKGKYSGTRIAARARNGKFISSVEATTIVRTKRTSKFLEELDSETGSSRHQTLLEAGYKGALVAAAEPTGRSLGNYVKTMEMYDEQSGNRAAREAAITAANRETTNPVVAINITMPVLVNPEMVDFEAELQKRKERYAKGPSFIDATVVSTNPPRE